MNRKHYNKLILSGTKIIKDGRIIKSKTDVDLYYDKETHSFTNKVKYITKITNKNVDTIIKCANKYAHLNNIHDLNLSHVCLTITPTGIVEQKTLKQLI